jgi:hypothetical protein
MVSCDTVDLGCSGGNTETAYDYIYDAGGLELESDYPYVSYFDITGTCELSDSKNVFAVTLDKYYTLSSEDDMQTYVLSTGPLSICAAATSWTSYTSGVVSTCDDDVNHCVQVTGVDTDNEYWIIRNRFAFSSHLQSLFFFVGSPLFSSPSSPFLLPAAGASPGATADTSTSRRARTCAAFPTTPRTLSPSSWIVERGSQDEEGGRLQSLWKNKL